MSLIEVSEISFSYHGQRKALDCVNLNIDAGESIAVMGPNGAGKSTLFQLFNGLLQAQHGDIHVDGKLVNAKNLPEIRRKVGMVFQDSDDQLFNSTVYHEVAYGLKNMNLSKEEIESRVDWALDLVGMRSFRKRSPFNLSGGEKKRIALASVLSMQPQLLVLDEPTNALDPRSARNLVALLSELNRELGMTLIFATHDANIVPYLASRVLLMNHGTIVLDGTTNEVFAQRELIDQLDLQLPYIAEFMHRLAHESLMTVCEIPLTIEDAIKVFHNKL